MKRFINLGFIIFAMALLFACKQPATTPEQTQDDTTNLTTYSNPVIPGFYPDPSVCRVGEDYYLVTSSFEYFPGVPVFHSKDMINWEQIGYCLTRDSQLPLQKTRASGGIYAPTIRHHKGKFYMVTTNVSGMGNFYVTTDNPAGEWSEPIKVEQGGIDPSLFFDDDGKVYFTSNAGVDGKEGIALSEIDIETGKLLTPTKHIWGGTGGRYPEGPHLYKIKDWFYLLISEGGTEYGHMITLARSKNPYGPYESCPHNPILTHRNHVTQSNIIQGTGHADIVEAHDGSWWMVFLGFRKANFDAHHLGRETFVAPATWTSDGWLQINKTGTVDTLMKAKTLPLQPFAALPDTDQFDNEKLALYWNFLRNPYPETWSLTAKKGWLCLNGTSVGIDSIDSPAFIGRRQQHFNFEASCLLDFTAKSANEEAGMTVLMNNNHHYEVALTKSPTGERTVIVRFTIGSIKTVAARVKVDSNPVTLSIVGDMMMYHLGITDSNGKFTELAKAETRYLSSEVAGGFTGVYIGLYATGNGAKVSQPAYFDWFRYKVK